MPSHDKPGCLILTGGRGSRLGDADKGLLEVHGKKLIEYVIDCVIADVDDIVISANRNLEHYRHYSPTVIPDLPEYRQQGPLAGIVSCLPHCRQPLVLVTACDIPVLPPGMTGKLLDALGNHDISICEVDQHLLPVFLCRQHLAASAGRALKDDQPGLLKWIRRQSHCIVPFQEPTPAFMNINSPEQLRKLSDLLAA
jgi:molybdopterin-guanine dinucleotide biosynthesis protein A